MSPAYPLALLVGLVEFAGGLLLILGAYTLAAATTLLVTMFMAAWKLHLPNGFFLNWTGAREQATDSSSTWSSSAVSPA